MSRIGASSSIARAFAVLLVSVAILAQPSFARVNRDLLRKLFDCQPCLEQCPMMSFDLSCEPVLEPGVCACCFQCARREGETCGLSTGRCSRGLSCRPMEGHANPLQALMDGTAVCVGQRRKRLW